eukprot:1149303-Pelagomonas_calceolata.AAC.7
MDSQHVCGAVGEDPEMLGLAIAAPQSMIGCLLLPMTDFACALVLGLCSWGCAHGEVPRVDVASLKVTRWKT